MNVPRWVLALIPAFVSVALALLFVTGVLANPKAFMRADLSFVVLVLGLTTSALCLAGVALWHRGQRLGERRARRKVQAEAADDRRRFLRRLDHELKNPLTAMRVGLANLAVDRSPEAVQSVEAQVQRVSRLTADLRKLAELGTRPLERAPGDVGELLQQVEELARERAEAEDRRFNLLMPKAPWPLPQISGDRDLLLLVLHNLVDNAFKFTFPGDTIEVRAFEDGASVVIEVADTGPGIPEAELPHVWEELYRGERARAVPGSGLGLALVRAIIERHGGTVAVRSRVAQGTVFTLRLPVTH
ncbi:MAG: sensor histidine kinase [Anaerolineales bacterium]